jgi:NAD(P)-dependent dehydrogenase (short-subunit alcohol dehydrogenase family)
MKASTILKSAAFALAAVRAVTLTARRARATKLAGRTVLVTGASRGLGRAVALELARRGCKVAICARTSSDLETVRAELVALGATVHAEVCDLRSMDQVQTLVENVRAHLGPIDVLVANAATIAVGPVESMTVNDFDDAMSSIFKTSLHAALAVLPSMRSRKTGTVAFITSIGGKIGIPHLVPYSTAKFAEVGLAEGLRAESAGSGINVLTVVPGLMRTGSHVHATFKGNAEKEYGWFGAGATAPMPMTIDAARAARRIARAIARGDDEIVLTPAAQLGVAAQRFTPDLLRLVLRLATSFLPRAPSIPARDLRRREGLEVERTSSALAVAFVRARGAELAAENNQV